MQTQEYNNLKLLIQTSPILSATERGEWLALLDLMNDKQLAELEKILTPIHRPQVQHIYQPKPVSVLPPVRPAAAVPPAQLPKLSHIVNLPNLGNLASPHTAANNLHSVILKPNPVLPAKKPSFAAKLKMFFTEKELPAGQENLELPAAAAIYNQQAQAKITGPLPKAPVAAPKPPVAPVNPVKPPILPSIISGPPAPAAQPLPKKAAPEADFAGLSEKIQREILATVKDPRQISVDMPKAAPAALDLDSLDGLATINSKLFQGSDFELLVSKVRKLVKQYGYFGVIFNLEKSPLYKNYLKTGMEILTKQTGFDQLHPGPDSFLTRQQFEKMTDLLRQIQVG